MHDFFQAREGPAQADHLGKSRMITGGEWKAPAKAKRRAARPSVPSVAIWTASGPKATISVPIVLLRVNANRISG